MAARWRDRTEVVVSNDGTLVFNSRCSLALTPITGLFLAIRRHCRSLFAHSNRFSSSNDLVSVDLAILAVPIFVVGDGLHFFQRNWRIKTIVMSWILALFAKKLEFRILSRTTFFAAAFMTFALRIWFTTLAQFVIVRLLFGNNCFDCRFVQADFFEVLDSFFFRSIRDIATFVSFIWAWSSFGIVSFGIVRFGVVRFWGKSKARRRSAEAGCEASKTLKPWKPCKKFA